MIAGTGPLDRTARARRLLIWAGPGRQRQHGCARRRRGRTRDRGSALTPEFVGWVLAFDRSDQQIGTDSNLKAIASRCFASAKPGLGSASAADRCRVRPKPAARKRREA